MQIATVNTRELAWHRARESPCTGRALVAAVGGKDVATKKIIRSPIERSWAGSRPDGRRGPQELIGLNLTKSEIKSCGPDRFVSDFFSDPGRSPSFQAL